MYLPICAISLLVISLAHCYFLVMQMCFTCLLWAFFSVAFAYFFHRKAKHQFVTIVEVEPSDYQIHSKVFKGVDDNYSRI